MYIWTDGLRTHAYEPEDKDDSYKYYRPNLGDQIGDDNRYVLLRKIGVGNNSNVWLAKDQSCRNTTYKALKVCTTGWTRAIDSCREMQVLEALRKKKESNGSHEERNNQSSCSDVAPDARVTGDRIEFWRYEVLRETLATAAPPSKTRRRMSLPISIDNVTYTFHKTALADEQCLESRKAPANTPIQHGSGPTADGTTSTHPGRHHVLDYLGTFKENRHQVIVSKPLAFSLHTLLKVHGQDSRPFSMSFVRKVTRQILQGIDFMHSELNMLYAGVKPRNVVLTFPNIDRMISHELERLPSSCNKSTDRPLEQSLGLSSYLQDPSILDEASFVLVDYGRSLWEHENTTQSVIFPSDIVPPEMLLQRRNGKGQKGWSKAVDVWMVGCLLMRLLTDHECFDNSQGVGESLSHVWRLIGNFPKHMAGGPKHIYSDAGLPENTLTLRKFLNVTCKLPDEEAVPLQCFLRRCLAIDPAKRASASELLEDPWLTQQAGTFVNLPAHVEGTHALIQREQRYRRTFDAEDNESLRCPWSEATRVARAGDETGSWESMESIHSPSDDIGATPSEQDIDTNARENALLEAKLQRIAERQARINKLKADAEARAAAVKARVAANVLKRQEEQNAAAKKLSQEKHMAENPTQKQQLTPVQKLAMVRKQAQKAHNKSRKPTSKKKKLNLSG